MKINYMDQTSILITSIAVLTGILVLVGVYSIILIADFRRALKHLNRILERVDSITEHVDTNLVKPTATLAGILALLREGSAIIHEVKEIAEESPAAAKVIASEAKEVIETVGEETRETISEAGGEAKEVTAEVSQEAQEFAIKREPEPMAARSLATHRRYFTKRR